MQPLLGGTFNGYLFWEALKIRATTHVTLMQQWPSAGWGDEMAVVQSLLSLHPDNF
jgi:hypothetical protein